MCVNNPKMCRQFITVKAYKVMIDHNPNQSLYSKIKNKLTGNSQFNVPKGFISSLLAGNRYQIGVNYRAGEPRLEDHIERSPHYEFGFHAFANEKDAWSHLYEWRTYPEMDMRIFSGEKFIVVEVELSGNIAYSETEALYVADQCKFIKILEK